MASIRVPFDELAARLPPYDAQRVTPEEYAARIEARQMRGVRRMIS